MDTHHPQQQELNIGQIPAILWGAPSDKLFLYVHGLNGCKEEAKAFARHANAHGWQVLSFDMPGHGSRPPVKYGLVPWEVVPDLEQVYEYIAPKYKELALYCVSAGAYFSMVSYHDKPFSRALFVSPILDMQELIKGLMAKAGVSEEELFERQIIDTQMGFWLIWDYWVFVNEHPLEHWPVPTSILYPCKDVFTSRELADRFACCFDVDLECYEEGEHWFHTPSQLKRLSTWISNQLDK